MTVSLLTSIVRAMDRRGKIRSNFVTEALCRELERRRRLDFRLSLEHPHPESVELVKQGLEGWGRSFPGEDASAVVDACGGKPVRWVAGEGWVEGGLWAGVF